MATESNTKQIVIQQVDLVDIRRHLTQHDRNPKKEQATTKSNTGIDFSDYEKELHIMDLSQKEIKYKIADLQEDLNRLQDIKSRFLNYDKSSDDALMVKLEHDITKVQEEIENLTNKVK